MLTQAEIAAIQGTDIYDDDYLCHYGKKGMHWGERLYQYKDGSLTPLGRIHYGIGERKKAKKKEIMQSGNVKKILKYQKHLTDKEFEKAMARAKKSEELRKVGEVAKKEKKAEAAEKAKAKLSEKELKNAKEIAKAESKKKVNAGGILGVLATATAVAVPIIDAWKKYKDIADAIYTVTGTSLPGAGEKEHKVPKKDKDKDKDKSASAADIASAITAALSASSSAAKDSSSSHTVEKKDDSLAPKIAKEIVSSPKTKEILTSPAVKSIIKDVSDSFVKGLTTSSAKEIGAGKTIVDEFKDVKMDSLGIEPGFDPWGFIPDT